MATVNKNDSIIDLNDDSTKLSEVFKRVMDLELEVEHCNSKLDLIHKDVRQTKHLIRYLCNLFVTSEELN